MAIKLDLKKTQKEEKSKIEEAKKKAAAVVYEEQDVQDVYEEQDVQEVFPRQKRSATYGKTQGRKGAKLDRINITLSPTNKEYAKKVAAKENLTMSEYINRVIDKVRLTRGPESSEGLDINYLKPDGSRINMGFSSENYDYLYRRARINSTSPSALVNQFIEEEIAAAKK